MIAIPVYDVSGQKTREVEVDPTHFDKVVRKPLLKESLIAFLASQRQGTHKTKTRAEVAGGNTKPWRQKGTGRARQGTIRAAQFVGGGRAHGPRPRDYSYRLPKRQRQLAVRSALRFHLENGTLSAVEGVAGLDQPSTKAVAGFLNGSGLAGRGTLLVSNELDKNLYLSARNLQKVDVKAAAELNAGHMMQRHNLVLTADVLDALVKGDAA